MLCAFGHRVAMLGVVGSSLKMVKFGPTTPNMSQQGGQTHTTCCTQQCCDMLSSHVVIVWPGLKTKSEIQENKNLLVKFAEVLMSKYGWLLKPRPNDRKNDKVTYRNIVGRNMSRAFGHMLAVVGSVLW